jgi:hypothetical protein
MASSVGCSSSGVATSGVSNGTPVLGSTTRGGGISRVGGGGVWFFRRAAGSAMSINPGHLAHLIRLPANWSPTWKQCLQ